MRVSTKVRVYGPRGTDLEKENQELMKENHILRSQLARIQSCADRMTEDIQSIRRGY
jgi:hypothetical protein